MESYTFVYFAITDLSDNEIAWVKKTYALNDAAKTQTLLKENGIKLPDPDRLPVQRWAFDLMIEDGALIIGAEDGKFSQDAAASFVQLFLKKFRPDQVIKFEWVITMPGVCYHWQMTSEKSAWRLANMNPKKQAGVYNSGICMVTASGYEYIWTDDSEVDHLLRCKFEKII